MLYDDTVSVRSLKLAIYRSLSKRDVEKYAKQVAMFLIGLFVYGVFLREIVIQSSQPKCIKGGLSQRGS